MNIVFDDAPLDQAVEGIINAAYFNPGEVCLRRLPPARPGVDLRAADLEAQEPDGHPSRGDPLDKNADVGAITFNRFDPAYLLADTRNPASAAREDVTASSRT